jgi:SOS-response transcriptional repressor LexA
MNPLGSGSIAVYEAIERVYSLEGHSPGITQIMALTGFRSKSSISYHLGRLEQAEWIVREPPKKNAIIPIHYPRVHYVRSPDVDGWVYAAPDHADTCPDCDRSRHAHGHCQPDDHPDALTD